MEMSFSRSCQLLGQAGDAREQADTRIMDVLQTPRRKRQKPLQKGASSVSCFIQALAEERVKETQGRGTDWHTKATASLSHATTIQVPASNTRAAASGKGGFFLP